MWSIEHWHEQKIIFEKKIKFFKKNVMELFFYYVCTKFYVPNDGT